jgi:DNA polymerase
MDTLTIDFETFYTREYSLMRMPTQAYVQSPYFEIIGVAVKRNAEDTQWYSGDLLSTRTWLRQFDWENSIAIAHNAQFDGAILGPILHIHPKRWFCTMFAARPTVSPFNKGGRVSLKSIAEYFDLPAKGTAVHDAIGLTRADFSAEKLAAYSEYCCHDVDLAYEIYQRLSPLLPESEQALIHETVRKVTCPVLHLDGDLLQARLATLKTEQANAIMDAGLPDEEALMSNPKFAIALENLGVDPPRKISARTGKENWAFAKTDVAFKALLTHPDPRVQMLMAARFKLKSTIEEKRLEKFIDLAELETPVSVPLRYYAAHTGRFGGSDGLNFQNLPREGELRRALVAPKGYRIVAGDLSQIEARITACLAGETELTDAFRGGEDVYCLFASKLYSRTITKDDKLERFMGKIAILGLGYGMGAVKLKATVQSVGGVSIDLEEAQRIVRLYRTTYPGIKGLWRTADSLLEDMTQKDCCRVFPADVSIKSPKVLDIRYESIRLPNGMDIHYPGLANNGEGYSFSYRGETKDIWGGGLIENIVQALAKIVVANAELKLAKRGVHAALQIHDELLYCVPTDWAEAVTAALNLALTAPVSFLPQLPVACEVKTGANYAEAK